MNCSISPSIAHDRCLQFRAFSPPLEFSTGIGLSDKMKALNVRLSLKRKSEGELEADARTGSD